MCENSLGRTYKFTLCEKINSDSDLTFESLISGTLMDQIDTYKQIKGNE